MTAIEGQRLSPLAITLPQSRPRNAFAKRPAADCGNKEMVNAAHHGETLTARAETFTPRDFKRGLRPSWAWLVALVLMVSGLVPLRAQTPSAAVVKIQTYYQQLMPTIQQAARLSVRERDKRFSPVFAAVFDIPTMTRLAVGPAWKTFSAEQQAAVRDAFARFIVAQYANQIKDYSGESFVVDPQTTPESRGGGEIVKTKLLQPGGRTVSINYLVRGERVVDIYLNGTISDLAMRRDEFASVVAAGGADALIKRLRDRTDNLLGN
jgi:phospholipid transport system substrate-binding protein